MRLWHYKLIPALPRQQLVSQWRECVLIAKSIADNGTPNHILVNPVMNYPLSHFDRYTKMVGDEMMRRGYNWNFHRYTDQREITNIYGFLHMDTDDAELFPGWHDDQYLMQCYYNLQEKHDRGGIFDEEWQKIQEVVSNDMYL